MKRIALAGLTLLLIELASFSPAFSDEAIRRELAGGVSVELRLAPSPFFVVNGLKLRDLDGAKQHIQFTVESSELENPPAILGEFKLAEDRLTFHPRFPLMPNTAYRVHIAKDLLDNSPENVDQQRLLFSLPTDEASTPEVVAVYPSANSLPENLLKFYLHFSQPMSRGEAYDRIHLLEDDVEIQEPFLELTEELWNADQTRFTLFIHPGRIKRGVQPRELRGPPLSDGREYTLRIDHTWESARGVELPKDFEKKFTVTAPEQAIVDPLEWKLESPAAASRQPVTLRFQTPLDHAMLQRVLEVKFNDGSAIDGEIQVQENETVWSFVPAAAWKVGAYNIEVATNLEDLSGNNLAAPFEVKLKSGARETPPSKVAIEFIVK